MWPKLLWRTFELIYRTWECCRCSGWVLRMACPVGVTVSRWATEFRSKGIPTTFVKWRSVVLRNVGLEGKSNRRIGGYREG